LLSERERAAVGTFWDDIKMHTPTIKGYVSHSVLLAGHEILSRHERVANKELLFLKAAGEKAMPSIICLCDDVLMKARSTTTQAKPRCEQFLLISS